MASEEPGTESVRWPQGRQREENLLLLFTQPAQVSAHGAHPASQQQPCYIVLLWPLQPEARPEEPWGTGWSW